MGYDHFHGKSTGAVRAEAAGLLSASRLAAQLRADKSVPGCTAQDIAAVLRPVEWHHSSKRFRRVFYYNTPWEDEIETLKISVAARKTNRHLKPLILLALLALTACATVGGGPGERWIPYPDAVRWIERLPYVPGELDCSGKAALLADYYQSRGLAAAVVLVPSPVLWTRYDMALIPGYHAVVLVCNPATGLWHLVDPTWTRGVDGLVAPAGLPMMHPAEVKRELAWALDYLKTIGLKMPE